MLSIKLIYKQNVFGTTTTSSTQTFIDEECSGSQFSRVLLKCLADDQVKFRAQQIIRETGMRRRRRRGRRRL